MRLIVDVRRRADGGLVGEITSEDAPAVSFSGWLELLQALESATEKRPGQDRQGVGWR